MAFTFVFALALLGQAEGSALGAYAETEDIAPGSKISSLAVFAHKKLAAESNSLDLKDTSIDKVLRASRQTVAGTNYKLSIATKPAGGVLDIIVFEQPWTQTLSITEATFTPSDSNTKLTVLSGSEIALDAKLFAEFEAEAARRTTEKTEALGASGHGQHSPPKLGENGHGQRQQQSGGLRARVKSVLRRLHIVR